ncbi:MAG: GNAT family N-acetyltransferase [Peptoniphilaceae bacterium]|nr:N-acetyltransferase [Peptoniphilaceae bacterium]MDY3738597.1 GNAT family N-acetyltransferase [Peptoniphilaceae bacterium]
MEIKIDSIEKRIEAKENEKTIGYVVFEEYEDYIDVYHTFVDIKLRGKGIANELFNKTIEFANEKNKKILPSCSYFRKKFEDHPEKYKDLEKIL